MVKIYVQLSVSVLG